MRRTRLACDIPSDSRRNPGSDPSCEIPRRCRRILVHAEDKPSSPTGKDIEARLTRTSCWPECSGSEEIVPELRREQEYRQELEAEIRRTEPHLLDSDVLFPEIEYWNYEGTRNPAYRESLRRIRSYEKALYRGSRFERIRRADVANELYLAVPDGLIHPDELAEGWGLLYIARNLTVKVAKPATWID